MKDHHQVPVASSEPFPTASFLPWSLGLRKPDQTFCGPLTAIAFYRALAMLFESALDSSVMGFGAMTGKLQCMVGMCMYMYIYMWALCQNIFQLAILDTTKTAYLNNAW